jgi:xylan 1,4-beta-xylosidase
VLEVSGDAKTWSVAVNHGDAGRDSPDDYEVLPRALTARYVRIRNVHSPNEAKFSLSDLRVFGKGRTPLPAKVSGVTIDRDSADPRHATIHWQPTARAEFYVVRLGTNPKELTQNYQIYDQATSADIRSLNTGVGYYVAVDAVNENGITRATSVVRLP